MQILLPWLPKLYKEVAVQVVVPLLRACEKLEGKGLAKRSRGLRMHYRITHLIIVKHVGSRQEKTAGGVEAYSGQLLVLKLFMSEEFE